MIQLLTLVLLVVLTSSTPASADPISALIVTAIGLTGTAAAVATFAITTALTFGASFVLGAIFKPNAAAVATGQERQASVTTLTLGEAAREMIVGMAATAGHLLDCFNYGGQYDTEWEVLLVGLADHACASLEGFYVGDTYVAFTGDGDVAGYNGQLRVYWRSGANSEEAFPEELSAHSVPIGPGNCRGIARVAVAYKADAPDAKNPIWTTGRPSFLWVVKGAKFYDPRKDDTVTGGSGAHRFADTSTWEWTENAEVCRYGFARGLFYGGQVGYPTRLLIGRGLSEYEAPPERVIPAANVCDELVDDPDGSTEPRYRVGGVIRATDSYQTVEQLFADAMAGIVIQPEGGVWVDPGEARSPVAYITDDDLISGVSLTFNAFRSDADRVNSVIPRYIEPTQKWQETAAPVQRLTDAILLDGPREQTLSLSLVPYTGQAQRIAQIRLRQAQYERSANIVLGPRFAALEEGDWIVWNSARHTAGEDVTFRIAAYGLGADWRNGLQLEETSFDVYGFGGAPLPATPHTAQPPADALALGMVTAEAIQIEGEGGSLVPAIRFHWAQPVNPAITTVRAEVKVGADGAVTPTSTTDVNDGVLETTNGIGSNVTYRVRLVPLGPPGRPIVPSSWIEVTTGSLVVDDTLHVAGRPSQVLVDAQDAAAALIAQVEATNAQLSAAQAQLHDAQVVVEAAQTRVAARLKQLGFGADLDAFALIDQALNDAGEKGVRDFLDRDVVTGEPLRLTVQRHTVENETFSTNFDFLGQRNAAGTAYILDFDKVQVSPDGTTLNERLFTQISQTGASVLASVAETYTAKTAFDTATSGLSRQFTSQVDGVRSLLQTDYLTAANTLYAVAATEDRLTVNFGMAISSATQGLISYADSDMAISQAKIALTASYEGYVGRATQGLISYADATKAVSEATIQITAAYQGYVAQATDHLITLADAQGAVVEGTRDIKATADKASADALVSQTAVAKLNGAVVGSVMLKATGTDASGRPIAGASVQVLADGSITGGGAVVIDTPNFLLRDPSDNTGKAVLTWSGGKLFAPYLVAESANIEHAAIGTLHLQDGSVTDPFSLTGTVGLGADCAGEVTTLNGAIVTTSTQTTILAFFVGAVVNGSASAYTAVVRCYVDGAEVREIPFTAPAGTQSVGQSQITYGPVGPGYHSFRVTVQAPGSTGCTAGVSIADGVLFKK